jgi:hypothetical protein
MMFFEASLTFSWLFPPAFEFAVFLSRFCAAFAPLGMVSSGKNYIKPKPRHSRYPSQVSLNEKNKKERLSCRGADEKLSTGDGRGSGHYIPVLTGLKNVHYVFASATLDHM